MADDLRVKLGKSKIESLNQGDPRFPWKPEVWNAAIAAFHAGIRRPEPRFPVLIRSDGPVDSPEKLQKLAGLSYIPKILDTKTVDLLTDFAVEDVRVCDITWKELKILRERTESEMLVVLFPDRRTEKLVKRDAWDVTSVKEMPYQPTTRTKS
ncbi:hypothetical protein F5Y12DRAFT_778908 [Xylaria sp. FL1777]|nr:hypothetical protein F5Y12DRAFT_778908 [Xylaria sp. FL1777]